MNKKVLWLNNERGLDSDEKLIQDTKNPSYVLTVKT